MLNPLDQPKSSADPTRIRWWPAIVIVALATAAITWVQAQTDWPFQKRNLTSLPIVVVGVALLLVWWAFFSRAPRAWRFGITLGLVVCLGAGAALFRIRGVSGDLVPILEYRWAQPASTPGPPPPASGALDSTAEPFRAGTNDFPQFYGPNRDGVLPGPNLATNWTAHPPTEIWRRKVGAAWSGFVIVGDLCLTQEQRGETECVVAYDLATGRERWIHNDPARYHTTIAGEGPRATPGVISNRVFAAGSTGILNALELDSGRLIWSRNVVAESDGKLPEWGFTSSPLVVDDRVIVHGGEGAGKLLFAFDADDGQLLWSAGTANPSYASPTLATLADTRQILAFTRRVVSGHDPATGATLWELPYASGNVVCATPVVIDANRVLFSSGYGRGSDLIEITREAPGGLAARRVWKTIRMKSKFAHLYARDGYLFGLDDGMLACVNLADGSQRWKEGRYGHGQGLLVGDLYLLMAESGQLVLLRPTPDGPNELARFRVFSDKTWNPIALAGDLLLVRNDQEAACLQLKLAP